MPTSTNVSEPDTHKDKHSNIDTFILRKKLNYSAKLHVGLLFNPVWNECSP